ncbi:MAG: phosphopentomutase [Acidobacteriia bacterium]|nr:phosphopentomutase [Terriglobia bacterium]
MSKFKRVIAIVLDSAGIGAMPDAEAWGDGGTDTLGHVCEYRALRLPHMASLGLGNIRPLSHIDPSKNPLGAYGKMTLASNGKDTAAGHWEMAGILTEVPFPTYPQGFPPRIVEPFEKAIGRNILGNYPASGTEIIKELGEEHMKTGCPIVYTSGDSVFQIAAHEDVIPVPELYRMCETARAILDGPDRVGRVIARPFVGTPGNFRRTERRHDYAIDPPKPMLLDIMQEHGLKVLAVGKIKDIYCGRGITEHLKMKNNAEGMEHTIAAAQTDDFDMIFTNLVDFDMNYGHRRDVEGYANALEEFDRQLGQLLEVFPQDDLLLITADHGCDPTYLKTADHTREYVPLLAYSKSARGNVNLGTRETLSDMGQTIAENFGLTLPRGKSFLSALKS